ncbi:MAG: hypothetical protein RIQ47_71 [Bacteroidota bacterium]|jgi:hypothetical protein
MIFDWRQTTGRILFCLLLLLLSRHLSFAQSKLVSRGSWGAAVKINYGFLMAHREALMPLQEQHLSAVDIAVFKTTSGEKSWQRKFIYPETGLLLSIINTGTKKLGTAIAIVPYIDFPLYKSQDDQCWLKYGMGLGYIESPFSPMENQKNAAIGSHLNGVVHIGFNYRKNFSTKTIGELGAGFTHFSNGSMKMPNLGINLPAVNIGIRHYMGATKNLTSANDSSYRRKGALHIFGAFGIKEIYPALGPKYTALTLSGTYFFGSVKKSDFGIGADLFYDNSLSVKYERESNDTASGVNLRPGIYGAYQLRIASIGLLFNMGFYPYTRYKNDGNFYHRIGLRYYHNRFFACVNLKTHYARADFFEWGLGWIFSKGK